MKKNHHISLQATMRMLPMFSLFIFMVACSDLKDDDHYNKQQTEIQNKELKIVDMSSEEYIKSESSLSKMNQLFIDNGIYTELNKKGQLSTILVVHDKNFVQPTEDVNFITRSHVSDISISPANLENGGRIMMWHNKYVNISIDSLGLSQGLIVNHISFNNGVVQEVVKTKTGYIYVIDEMIDTPTSLYDYITSLGDDYSMFREMVLASGGKEFDRVNSKAISVNDEGNTVYDSVFIYKNTYFENVGFDMNSESLTATMLLCSNDVIQNALNDAHQRLASWNMQREDSILLKWILEVSFFKKRYAANEIQTAATDTIDLRSIFSRQWRTNMHEVDTQNPEELSNGLVYRVKRLHIPNNVLMYRLKDWFYYYEYCTDEQKTNYFKMSNMAYSKCSTDVAAWTPWAGVWPEVEDRVLILKKDPSDLADENGLQLDFTPLKLEANATGGTQAVPWVIPPGTYRLAFGSKQNQNLNINISVLVEGQVVAKSDVIALGSATTYHYDRGTTLSDRYPEGYDATYVREMGGNSKASNYDTDGGPAIDEVRIPDIKGDGSPVPIVLRITAETWNGQTSFTLCHWCLRPTTNNY